MPPAVRKATATKATAKKTTAKKTTAKKTTAKKATAKKTTPKKAMAKKATATKATAGTATATTATTARASTPPTAAHRPAPQVAASAAVASAQAGVEDAVARIRELQGQLLETARSGGAAYLSAYEKNLSSMLALTESAAASTQLTWAVTLANNYADFVKRLNETVLKAGRQALG
jgi:hypothetical protein